MSLAENVEYLRRLRQLTGLSPFGGVAPIVKPRSRSPLVETARFGSNPGALKMFSYVPTNLQQPRALVVVLHGCGQTVKTYDVGTGWSRLARQYGFALLMPEQQSSNNSHGCFNWFQADDVTREHGEVASIRQMIARMTRDHGIDRHRIFVTGLSAGGAMAIAMLATYPEVFAAGAVIAGLPFGVAGNMREALRGMFHSSSRPASELGDLVRAASNHHGPWPKLSVWHGSADRTVDPANAGEIIKQWLDLHDLPERPMSNGLANGHPHQVWWDGDGETVVESYTLTDMGHGTPLGLADNDERYGNEGAFLIDAGISSTFRIAKFFGLTEWIRPRRAAAESPSARLIPKVSPLSMRPAPPPAAHLDEVLPPLTTARSHLKSARKAPRRAIDVGAVIARALSAAGLRK